MSCSVQRRRKVIDPSHFGAIAACLAIGAVSCSATQAEESWQAEGGAGGAPVTLSAGGGGLGVGEVLGGSCEDAAKEKSYVGCDFWPTVTPNVVWDLFDYAV